MKEKQKESRRISEELSINKKCAHYDGINCPCPYKENMHRIITIAEKSFRLISSIVDDEKFVASMKKEFERCPSNKIASAL